MTSVTVQVPTPLPLRVEGAQETAWPFGSVTVQETVPVGVTPGPDTVAVKVKLPPVATPAAVVIDRGAVVAVEMEAALSWPVLES